MSQSIRIKKHIQFNVSVKFNYIFILWESVLSLNSICDTIKSQKRNPRPQTGKEATSPLNSQRLAATGCAVGRRSREVRPLKQLANFVVI